MKPEPSPFDGHWSDTFDQPFYPPPPFELPKPPENTSDDDD